MNSVILHPILPGQEKTCPSWIGFSEGADVQHVDGPCGVANYAVTDADGALIVRYLPLSYAVSRAQYEAVQRRQNIFIVGKATPLFAGIEKMTPAGTIATLDGSEPIEAILAAVQPAISGSDEPDDNGGPVVDSGEDAQSTEAHDFKPARLTPGYAFRSIQLWLAGKISWSTLRWSLRHHPAAICGRGGSYIVDREASQAYFGE